MLPSARGLRELAVVATCAFAQILHQATHWSWTIEDAAICYAFARNLVAGHGLVPSPGGERVEAFSDPAWVALLAVFEAVGIDGFSSAKPLAMLLATGTLVISWRTARLALPEHQGPGALLAPVALAASAQLAIWSASGLENALFSLFLAGAIHRTLVEIRDGGFPWSAALYVGLALTRPEGLVYAGVGLLALVAGTADARRSAPERSFAPVALWLAVVAVPLALVEAARLWYFAWPLPNPFYAKVASKGIAPLDWTSRGWMQLRDWADRLWTGWLAWIPIVGVTGVAGWRPRVGLGVAGVLALSLLWRDAPEAVVIVRVLGFLAAGALIPLLGLGTPGGPARALCAASAYVGLLFMVVANGDWMGAYRFLSLVSGPLAVLFAVGASTLADELERRVSGGATWGPTGWIAASVGAALLFPPNLSQTRDHLLFNRDETPQWVKRRVDYLTDITRQTFHDDPVVNLDIDQGAFLFWAPRFRQLDIGMLVEIPMARHWFQQRDFVREHVFRESKPTFSNVGGYWVRYTGLRRYAEWQAAYFETPGYPVPEGRFHGVFARRDLVVAPTWDGTPGRRVGFEWGIALEGADAPAPWTPGRRGYLELPLSVSVARTPEQQITVYAFVARDGVVAASWPLDPGYGLLPMDRWAPGEVFRGRFSVAVPAEMAPGRYDLGVVLLGPRGFVIPAKDVPPGAVADDPVLARGEVRFPGLVEVVAADALAGRIEVVQAEIARNADAGVCERAEDGWIRLKRHRPVDWPWHDTVGVENGRILADCWARRAEADPEPVTALARAHRWDFESPELARVGGPVAERLLADGREARARGDWETAYARFSAVLSFQPWRSWARRWAEEARDHRLDLLDDVRVGIGGEDDLRAIEAGSTP